MKQVWRLLFLAGAVGIGLLFFRTSPRDVTLVYSLAGQPPVRALEVEITRGSEAIRRAEFSFPGGPPKQVEHKVKLTDGAYRLHFRITAQAGGPAVALERDVNVSESGTIVLPL
jgi:hypothetical protein